MTDVEIIRLINSYLRENDKLKTNIESLKFIINFKDKTISEYSVGIGLKPRDRVYEYIRINCAASINLIDQY